MWTPTILVAIDDEYDRERADDNAPAGSRLGRYLATRTGQLDDDERADPVDFAGWVWSVAAPPIMSPGYVRVRPDLSAVSLVRAEDDHALVLEVEVPVPHDRLASAARPPYPVADWEADRYDRGPYRSQWVPREDQPALLLRGLVRIPAGDWPLHRPRRWEGPEEMVAAAKAAVAVLVKQINAVAGPRVAALLGEGGGAW